MNYLARTTLHFVVGILASLLLPALPLQGQELEWARQFGGPGYSSGNSVAVDAAGNVYTTGSFSGTVDFDPGAGVFYLNSTSQSSAFVSKLDGDGKLVWARSMSGLESSGMSVAVDATGSVYISGSFRGTVDFDPGGGIFSLSSAGYESAFATKLDSVGKFVWAKELASGDPADGRGLAVDGGGNVYVTGHFTGISDLDPGPAILLISAKGSDGSYITKLDGNGNLVWARAVRSSTDGREESHGVAVDANRNVYVTGTYAGTTDFGPLSNGSPLVETAAGDWDGFVVKLDSAGNSVWVQSMGGPNFDQCTSVAVDGDGNVYLTGAFSGTAGFYPGRTRNGITPLVSETSAGGEDIFVVKLNSVGTGRWVRSMGGPQKDLGSSVAVDSSGNVYTTGTFRVKADFDPSASVSNLTSAGSRDAFLNKLDSNGNFEWVRHIGGGTYGDREWPWTAAATRMRQVALRSQHTLTWISVASFQGELRLLLVA